MSAAFTKMQHIWKVKLLGHLVVDVSAATAIWNWIKFVLDLQYVFLDSAYEDARFTPCEPDAFVFLC